MDTNCLPGIGRSNANSQASRSAFWLNQKFLSVLTWFWLAVALWAFCWTDWVFQPSWEYRFCNCLWNPGSAVMHFSIRGISVCRRNCGISYLVAKFFLVRWFCQGIQFVWLQIGFSLLSAWALPGECTWRLRRCSR